jgi:hypothetical protein
MLNRLANSLGCLSRAHCEGSHLGSLAALVGIGVSETGDYVHTHNVDLGRVRL